MNDIYIQKQTTHMAEFHTHIFFGHHHISPPFTENLMRKYRTGGFCEIPPGDSKAEEDMATLPLSVHEH